MAKTIVVKTMKEMQVDQSVEKKLYQLKVSLVDAKPAIWRRIVVQSQMHLDELHEVLQVVMGWENCHLHHFKHKNQFFSDAETCESIDSFTDESTVMLADVLQKPKDKLLYEYDFGDSWLHAIVLEKILPLVGKPPVAQVLAGEGACPLEDIGGLDGWYYFLDVITNPNDPDYQEEDHIDMREWVEKGFNPALYDMKTVNDTLANWL